MALKNFWVGERPGGAWVFQVLTPQGQPQPLGGFTKVRMLVITADDDLLVYEGDNTFISNQTQGLVTFVWPDKSIFTKEGAYIMQIELESDTSTRRTTVQDIFVRELGDEQR